MSGRFMRVKKIIVPTLTMIIMASQLMGCAVVSPKEAQEMTRVAQEIEIEIAVPISVEQGEKQSIEWIRLDQLTTYADFRRTMDDIMKITPYGDGSKNGIAFINLDGSQEGNNTFYNAMMNRKFIANFLDDMAAQMMVADGVEHLYVDVEENDSLYAAINAYWNLLPDSAPNYFNPEDTLSRLEAMSLIARASNQVTEDFGDDIFTNAVGSSEYTDYASLVADNSYLSIDDNSLNESTANGTITRGEYIYMLINNVFGSDRMSRADIKKVQFNDCKNGGDIASEQNLNGDYSGQDELKYAIENPDDGCPERMYRALVTAQELGIISKDTRWDEGLTKKEAIQLYVDTLQAFTKENGYIVDSINGNSVQVNNEANEIEVDQEALDEIVGVPEEEVIANENDKADTIEEGVEWEIIPMDDTVMYCVSGTANIRSGAGTQYDKIGSLSYGQEVVINGKVEDTEGGKLWYVIKSDDSIQMVSGSLLSTTKPVAQQGNNGNGGNNGGAGGNAGGSGQQQQPVVQEPEEPTERPDNAGQDWMDSMFGSDYGHDMNGANSDHSQDWGDFNWN